MDNVKKLLLSCYVIFACGALLIWMHQNSLATFWQQNYHQPPPWQALHQHAFWQAGTRVHSATAKAVASFVLEMRGQPLAPASVPAPAPAPASTPTPTPTIEIDLAAGLNLDTDTDKGTDTHTDTDTDTDTAMTLEPSANSCQCPVCPSPEDALAAAEPLEEPLSAAAEFKQQAEISTGQRVFFAGDSMMQGVAPHLSARLRREYGLSSLDLSRHSTGLAYPSAFNWPETIAQTLNDNADIKLLAVFLGPNDPWNMPSSPGGKFLRYASPAWEKLYRSRIREIIHSAQSRNVDVIWVSPPNMRPENLSDRVRYLNGLYESEVLQAGEVFLSSNQVFQYPEATYSDYMGDGSLKQKMRSGDGIHFTIAGQRTLADAVFNLITFIPQQQAEHDTQPASSDRH